jgi:hypothetical protein
VRSAKERNSIGNNNDNDHQACWEAAQETSKEIWQLVDESEGKVFPEPMNTTGTETGKRTERNPTGNKTLATSSKAAGKVHLMNQTEQRMLGICSGLMAGVLRAQGKLEQRSDDLEPENTTWNQRKQFDQ